MSMQAIRERFPDAEVMELTTLVQEEEVGLGPWRLYVFDRSGYHSGGAWFRLGKRKYPAEEITFINAKERAEAAIAVKREVRICDGMDHLVFHSVNGEVVFGSTFWNQANPDPAAVKVADRLKGKVK